jgi:hypothetical protein
VTGRVKFEAHEGQEMYCIVRGCDRLEAHYGQVKDCDGLKG